MAAASGPPVLCSHCHSQVGVGQPPGRPFPTIIIQNVKQKILGSPLPSRVDTDIEMDTLGAPSNIERKKSRTPEEENQIKAKKQFRSDLNVYACMLIVLLLAAAIVGLKMYVVEKFFPHIDTGPTFKPLAQMTASSKMYNGIGLLPCNGFVPCQPEHLSPELNFLRLEGAMEGWKEEWDGYQGVYKAGGRQDALWALGQFGDGLRKKT